MLNNLNKTILCAASLISISSVQATEIKTKNSVNDILDNPKSIVYNEGNWTIISIDINNFWNKPKSKYSTEALEIIKNRIQNKQIIIDMEIILSQIEKNESNFTARFRKIKPSNSQFEKFNLEQEQSLFKFVQLFAILPEDSDTCFLMWKYLFDHAKDKTRAIDYFKKSLTKSTKRLQSIHRVFFHRIFEIIAFDKTSTENQKLLDIISDFKPFYKWEFI